MHGLMAAASSFWTLDTKETWGKTNGGHQEEQQDVSHHGMMREKGWFGLEMRQLWGGVT